MVGSDVSCKYPPLAITTGLSESFKHNLAALPIQPIGFLFQLSSNGPNPGGVRWQWRGIEATMMSIDRSSFIAVKKGAVAGECNEVCKRVLEGF